MGDFWKLASAAKGNEVRPPSASVGLDQGSERRMRGEAQRLPSQHHQLNTFFGMVLDALGRGSLQAARIAFTRFRDALDAHITVENEVFFPALRSLSPELTDELAALVDEHAEIHGQLERLYDRLAEGAAEIFVADLDGFATRLADHEIREERMVARVTQKLPDGEVGPDQPEDG